MTIDHKKGYSKCPKNVYALQYFALAFCVCIRRDIFLYFCAKVDGNLTKDQLFSNSYSITYTKTLSNCLIQLKLLLKASIINLFCVLISIPVRAKYRPTPFVQALNCWLINHVIYLKLNNCCQRSGRLVGNYEGASRISK